MTMRTAAVWIAVLALVVPASTRTIHYSNQCLPFTPEIEGLFHQVARAMYLAVREDRLRPCLQDAASVDPVKFSRLIGTDVVRAFNAYLPETNTIVLATWYPDTLAHEFVHYFQVQYQGVSLASDARDWAERQATAIQNMFRNGPPLTAPKARH